MNNLRPHQEENMEKLDIEKMSKIDLSQDSVKSISEKCNDYNILKKQIEKYCGQTINGVYITESGVLAAAHLAGQGNVKKFFRRGYEFKDGFGTKMTTYMAQFGGYYLDL